MDESARQIERLSRLIEVSKAVAAQLDLDPLLQRIVDTATCLVSAEFGGLLVLGEDKEGFQFFKVSSDLGDPQRLPTDTGLLGLLCRQDTPVRLEDIHAHSQAGGFPPDHPRVGAFLSVPLMRKERSLGALFVGNEPDGRTFTADDEELLLAFAAQATIAIENAYLYTQAKRRGRELEALYQAGEELYRHLDLDQVLQALVDVSVDILQADKSALLVWDKQQERLVMRASRGLRPETVARASFALGEGIVGRVAASGEPMVVEDTFTDSRVAWRITGPEGIRSFMHAPIKIGDQVFGVFSVNYVLPRAFDGDDRRLFLTLARRAAQAIENARLYEQAQQAAALQERRRIALALHDTVVQMLFSIGLEAQWCLVHLPLDEEGRRRLQVISRLAARSGDELRGAIFALRSLHVTGDNSLRELLREQVAEFQIQSSTAATLILPPQMPNLAPPVSEAIYRIVRESLSNIRKHASASTVIVGLHCDKSSVIVTVQDDGVGLAKPLVPEDEDSNLHFGVATMRQLAKQAQGSLTITSNDDQGVTVKACFPLREGGPR